MTKITESEIEKYAIELLEKKDYQYIYAPSIVPDSETPERQSFEDVLLIERMQTAVSRINPSIPADIREDAIKQIQRLNSPELIANNEAFHRILTEGIKVTYQIDGHSRGDYVWLIDFKNPENQFTVYQTPEGKNSIEVLNEFSTTEIFSVVQNEGKSEVVPLNYLRNNTMNIFTSSPIPLKTMNRLGL